MVSITTIALIAVALPPIDTLDAEALLLHVEEATEILERLDELRRRPIDLNTCSIDDLLDLPFLSAAEASAILSHRRIHGSFPLIDSLRAVIGLDAATFARMLPFVSARLPARARRRPPLQAEVIQRWTRKLERADGFRRDSTGYIGGPNVLQTRLRFGLGKPSIRAGFDKDAGEPMIWDVRSRSLGYDFMAGHVQIESVGWIRRVVAGDFSPRFAHGILLRGSGNVRTGASAGRGGAASLRPYASTAEYGHFRGVGLELAPASWLALTAFASRRRIDAGIDTTSHGDFPAVSRKSSGLHRTASERRGRGALQESMVAGALSTAVGPIAVAGAFFVSEEVVGAPMYPRALRRRTSGSSLSAGASFGALYFAAEWAPTTGVSTAMDVRSGRHGRLQLSLRRAQPYVYTPYSTLAGGSTGLTDGATEVGLHGRHRLSRTTSVEFALRHSFRRAPTDRVPFATVNSAADLLLSHTLKPWLILTLRASRRRSGNADVCGGGAIRCLGISRRHAARFQLDYRHSRHFETRIRAELVSAGNRHPAWRQLDQDAASTGFLVYEELRLHPTDALLIAGRLAVFSPTRMRQGFIRTSATSRMPFPHRRFPVADAANTCT